MTITSPRKQNTTKMRPIVSRLEWEAAREQLLIKEQYDG